MPPLHPVLCPLPSAPSLLASPHTKQHLNATHTHSLNGELACRSRLHQSDNKAASAIKLSHSGAPSQPLYTLATPHSFTVTSAVTSHHQRSSLSLNSTQRTNPTNFRVLSASDLTYNPHHLLYPFSPGPSFSPPTGLFISLT